MKFTFMSAIVLIVCSLFAGGLVFHSCTLEAPESEIVYVLLPPEKTERFIYLENKIKKGGFFEDELNEFWELNSEREKLRPIQPTVREFLTTTYGGHSNLEKLSEELARRGLSQHEVAVFYSDLSDEFKKDVGLE